MITLQEYLNQKFTSKKSKNFLKKERKKVESIIVVKDMWSDDKNPLVTKEKAKKIDGRELDLTNFANLKEIKIDGNYLKSPLVKLELGEQPKLDFLYLPNNQLTHLDLTACPDLSQIWLWNNHLISLKLSKSNKLVRLDLSRNNFPNTQDLSIFSYLINLTNLNLGGDNQEKINQGIYNRFTGSLEPLKNMNKLEWLSIGNTDLDSGLEYLPESIKYFNCSFEQREDAKCKIFAKILKNIERESFHQQLKFYKQKKIEKQISVQTDKEHIKIKPILNHLLGKGGFGEVHYGKWKLQEVAVKKLYLSLPNISQTDLKDIRKEIDILKNLRNRYIIQYYDTYSDDQELFIIMDYAENGTLTKLINNNESKEHDWNFNTNLIKQMVLGLAYIHQEGVIHRDLKSLNILLTDGNQAKISDFGLSRTKIASSSQSKHSNVVGTLRWMAPELLKGEKYSEQSDIYALGMIMWEIVAKCTIPFKDIDNNLVGFHIISNGKETIPTDTPQNIQGIIQVCWKVNPSERITLEDMLKTIEGDKTIIPQTNIESSSAESNKQSYDNSWQQGLQIPSETFNQLNLEETPEQQTLQIQPPYGTSGSSKN